MKIELFMSKLRHQVCEIVGICQGIVAIGGRRFVGVAKASEVRSNDGKRIGQEGKDSVPVEAILRRTMEEEEGWT